MKYKVVKTALEDDIYQILERNYEGINWTSSYPPVTTVKNIPTETWDVVFQGTLPECDAWLNLKEKEYL